MLFKRKNAVGIGGRVDRDRDELCFLRNCRRLAPERTRLLTRFDSVIDRFCDVIDAKSGQILLRPKALEVVKLFGKHIEAGCLSKPDGVPRYYATTGKSEAGITTRRCVFQQYRGLVCVFCVTFLSLAGTATISTHNIGLTA